MAKVEIDVKGTTYYSGRLLAVKGKQREDVDVYALMVGRFPTFRFAGCATASELLRPQRLINLGHGDTYSMTQQELAA